jgi:hypothetical protein
VNKKPSTEGDKTPTRGEKNLYFSELPKNKVLKKGRITL